MVNFNYSLPFEDYTWENAILWGNFKGHCKKADEGTFGHRVIHVLIAAAEFLPIIGQIASIFETIIIKNFGKPAERQVDPAENDQIINIQQQSNNSDQINRISDEFSISKQELQNDVIISEDTISKIQSRMKNILQKKEEGGIKLYRCQQQHLVFSIDTVPEYIFKMNSTDLGHISKMNLIAECYTAMVDAQTVCRTHQLGLLVIPRAKLFTIEADGKKYDIIAEKILDFTPRISAQEQYFEEYASSLNAAIQQLAVFICKTNCSVVDWGNIPVLNNSLNEVGQRKIGLIHIEERLSKIQGLFGGVNQRGLVRCVNEEQGKIVEEVAKQNALPINFFSEAYETRKKEIEDGRNLKEYYKKRNIVTGYEPIQVNIHTLGLDLTEKDTIKEYIRNEEGKYVVKDERVITLEEVSKDVIEKINQSILQHPETDSVKGKRNIFLNTDNEPFLIYGSLGLSEKYDSEEGYDAKNSWLHRIVDSLVTTGHLFRLNGIRDSGYYIQA
ncbi:MAG TPA: hypothetical protein VIH61_02945 [Waddliaceae bacterium]